MTPLSKALPEPFRLNQPSVSATQICFPHSQARSPNTDGVLVSSHEGMSDNEPCIGAFSKHTLRALCWFNGLTKPEIIVDGHKRGMTAKQRLSPKTMYAQAFTFFKGEIYSISLWQT